MAAVWPHMSTTLTVGKARLSTVELRTAGSINTTASLTVDVGNPSALRARVNPNNPREVGILGLALSSGVNVHVTSSGHTKSELIVISDAPPAPTQDGITIGAFGDEIDPPDWLSAA